jgi:hypothetical protein
LLILGKVIQPALGRPARPDFVGRQPDIDFARRPGTKADTYTLRPWWKIAELVVAAGLQDVQGDPGQTGHVVSPEALGPGPADYVHLGIGQ